MLPSKENDYLEDEEIPLTANQENKSPTQLPIQENQKIIYPQDCNGATKPTKFFCNTCGITVVSTITAEITSETWFAVIVLCFFPVGGFCLIPLMIDYMKDYTHRCRYCQKIVGTRHYTISKPLKIIILIVIVLVVLFCIAFIISAIFFGNAMWEDYKRIRGYEREFNSPEQ